MMIIKRFLTPQLSVALSFFAASGCFAAVPNFYMQNDSEKIEHNATTTKQDNSKDHILDESHKNISLKNSAAAQPATNKFEKKSPTETKAEDYKQRLAAIKESYNLIAARVAHEESQAATQHTRSEPQYGNDTSGTSTQDTNIEQLDETTPETTKIPLEPHFAAAKKRNRLSNEVALGGPNVTQQQYQEEQDWGNNAKGAQDMVPGDIQGQEQLPNPEDEDLFPSGETSPGDEMIQEDAPNNEPFDDESEDGVLTKEMLEWGEEQVADTDTNYDEGRRQESRDVRQGTQLPGSNDFQRSTITTDGARKSRVPKTSMQSQRQREATNSLRNRMAGDKAPTQQFEYYEDYLESIADQTDVKTDKPQNPPERKQYTKPRRRPVNPEALKKDETAYDSPAPTPSTTPTRNLRDHVKRRPSTSTKGTTNVSTNPSTFSSKPVDTKVNANSSSFSRGVEIQNPTSTTTKGRARPVNAATARAKKVTTPVKKVNGTLANNGKATARAVSTGPAPVAISRSMVKGMSIQQPQVIGPSRNYIAENQSLNTESDEDYEDEDQDYEDENNEDTQNVTERDQRPNWYERLDDQRRERSIQRRVRYQQGEPAPQQRGYPTIPQYTSGNTTPNS